MMYDMKQTSEARAFRLGVYGFFLESVSAYACVYTDKRMSKYVCMDAFIHLGQ